MNLRTLVKTNIFTILLHSLVWTGLFLLPMMDEDPRHLSDYFLVRNAFFTILLIAFYYLNYYKLIPSLLLPNRILSYYLIILFLVVAICIVNFGFANLMDNLFQHQHNRPGTWRRLTFPFFPVLFMFGISTAIRLTSEWFRIEKEKKDMENEKLISELAFLKSQVNPHFLFNILNNICSLARKKSDKTEDSIIKLSQIMRYMLYDSKDEKVPLEKEVDYLKNYIELQQMRLSGAVTVDFQVDGDVSSKMIEPLLLIPFVENAFKHGITYREDSGILIRLEITKEAILFMVENHIARKQENHNEGESGIGLKNVLRRLQLLYPDKNKFTCDDDGIIYRIQLKILS
ncbi:MAG: sensor histidine kinase [Syntrophothermus sp.]